MRDRIWYAVQKSPEDTWDYGSSDFDEAKEMLINQGCGLIAEIDTETNFCLNKFWYEEYGG